MLAPNVDAPKAVLALRWPTAVELELVARFLPPSAVAELPAASLSRPKATDQSPEASLKVPQATAPRPSAVLASLGVPPSISQTSPAWAVVAAAIASSRTVIEAARVAGARVGD